MANRDTPPKSANQSRDAYWPYDGRGYTPSAPPEPPRPPRGGTAVVNSPTAKPNRRKD